MDAIMHLLLLVIIANGAPVFMHYVLGSYCAWPVDFEKRLADGRPLFGKSKTWRGLLASLVATSLCAYLLGYTPETGLQIGAYSMLGDLFSSFVKRRMGLPSSSKALFLDQIPEVLLPTLMLMDVFYLDLWSVILVVSLFVVAELSLSKILYKWGMRQHPY